MVCAAAGWSGVVIAAVAANQGDEIAERGQNSPGNHLNDNFCYVLSKSKH